jgi:uncharacterized protein (TIGR02996 family)
MDEQALLHAVCANPDDDAPRLVYADWLEEHGRQERAELIRVQIDLSRSQPGEDTTGQRRRESALLREFGATWTAELPQLGDLLWGEFERGFVSAVTGTWADFAAHGTDVFRSAPVSRWNAIGAFHALRGFRNCSLLARLSHLSISFENRFGDRLARKIADSPRLAGLRSLRLDMVGIGDPGAWELGQSDHLRNLVELSLSQNGIGPHGAAALAASPNMRHIRRLVLSRNVIGESGARSLATSRMLVSLEVLQLNGNGLDGGSKRLLRQRFGAKVCRF